MNVTYAGHKRRRYDPSSGQESARTVPDVASVALPEDTLLSSRIAAEARSDSARALVDRVWSMVGKRPSGSVHLHAAAPLKHTHKQALPPDRDAPQRAIRAPLSSLAPCRPNDANSTDTDDDDQDGDDAVEGSDWSSTTETSDGVVADKVHVETYNATRPRRRDAYAAMLSNSIVAPAACRGADRHRTIQTAAATRSWSVNDSVSLVELVSTHGSRWKALRQLAFPNHSVSTLKSKWQKLREGLTVLRHQDLAAGRPCASLRSAVSQCHAMGIVSQERGRRRSVAAKLLGDVDQSWAAALVSGFAHLQPVSAATATRARDGGFHTTSFVGSDDCAAAVGAKATPHGRVRSVAPLTSSGSVSSPDITDAGERSASSPLSCVGSSSDVAVNSSSSIAKALRGCRVQGLAPSSSATSSAMHVSAPSDTGTFPPPPLAPLRSDPMAFSVTPLRRTVPTSSDSLLLGNDGSRKTLPSTNIHAAAAGTTVATQAVSAVVAHPPADQHGRVLHFIDGCLEHLHKLQDGHDGDDTLAAYERAASAVGPHAAMHNIWVQDFVASRATVAMTTDARSLAGAAEAAVGMPSAAGGGDRFDAENRRLRAASTNVPMGAEELLHHRSDDAPCGYDVSRSRDAHLGPERIHETIALAVHAMAESTAVLTTASHNDVDSAVRQKSAPPPVALSGASPFVAAWMNAERHGALSLPTWATPAEPLVVLPATSTSSAGLLGTAKAMLTSVWRLCWLPPTGPQHDLAMARAISGSATIPRLPKGTSAAARSSSSPLQASIALNMDSTGRLEAVVDAPSILRADDNMCLGASDVDGRRVRSHAVNTGGLGGTSSPAELLPTALTATAISMDWQGAFKHRLTQHCPLTQLRRYWNACGQYQATATPLAVDSNRDRRGSAAASSPHYAWKLWLFAAE